MGHGLVSVVLRDRQDSAYVMVDVNCDMTHLDHELWSLKSEERYIDREEQFGIEEHQDLHAGV